MITPNKKSAKIIRPHDVNFTFNDGMVVYSRASLEIKDYCPDYYKQVIMDAYNNGWIIPVAQMPEREYMLMGLSN